MHVYTWSYQRKALELSGAEFPTGWLQEISVTHRRHNQMVLASPKKNSQIVILAVLVDRDDV